MAADPAAEAAVDGRAASRPERAVAPVSSFCMLKEAMLETLTDVINGQRKSLPGWGPSAAV
jgi:hypothetical protein